MGNPALYGARGGCAPKGNTCITVNAEFPPEIITQLEELCQKLLDQNAKKVYVGTICYTQ